MTFLQVKSLNRHHLWKKIPFPHDIPQLTLHCVIQAVVGTVAHPALMDLRFLLEPKKGVGEVFEWDSVPNITSGTLNSHLGPLGLTVYALINKQITVVLPQRRLFKGRILGHGGG